jgi:hypothetical protein
MKYLSREFGSIPGDLSLIYTCDDRAHNFDAIIFTPLNQNRKLFIERRLKLTTDMAVKGR